jgi:hypothetical protein
MSQKSSLTQLPHFVQQVLTVYMITYDSWCQERLRRRALPRWFIVDHIPRNAGAKSIVMHSLECLLGRPATVLSTIR